MVEPRVQNHVKLVAQLRREYKKGMPDGLDEQYFKKIRHLFSRIDELEKALYPFAVTAERERKFTGDVLSVNRSDCERAIDVLDEKLAIEPPREEFGIPARG